MTSTTDIPTHSTIGLPSQSSSYGDSPPGSVMYRKVSHERIKQRASRAGTRSVNTLTTAQLDRKRANDREAQRAIRQRTKDHIDNLEKTLNDIKESLETREKLLTAAHSRNRELEEENAVLRLRLSDANIPTSLPTKCEYGANITNKYSRPSDAAIASAPQSAVSEASGSVSQRSGSISHGFALSNSTITDPMNGAWQQQSGFAATNGPLMLSTNNDAQSRNMTGWRARDSPQAMSEAVHNPQGLHPPQTIPYGANTADDRNAWSGQYEFGVPARQPTQHYPLQTPGQQTEHHYSQAQASPYQGTPQQPQSGFQPPLVPPQNDFSQAFYQYQGQAYPAQPQYQQTPNQSANAAFVPSQVQHSPVSATQYHNNAAEHAFQQQVHPPMQLRDDAEFRGYTTAQFSPG